MAGEHENGRVPSKRGLQQQHQPQSGNKLINQACNLSSISNSQHAPDTLPTTHSMVRSFHQMHQHVHKCEQFCIIFPCVTTCEVLLHSAARTALGKMSHVDCSQTNLTCAPTIMVNAPAIIVHPVLLEPVMANSYCFKQRCTSTTELSHKVSLAVYISGYM